MPNGGSVLTLISASTVSSVSVAMASRALARNRGCKASGSTISHDTSAGNQGAHSARLVSHNNAASGERRYAAAPTRQAMPRDTNTCAMKNSMNVGG